MTALQKGTIHARKMQRHFARPQVGFLLFGIFLASAACGIGWYLASIL